MSLSLSGKMLFKTLAFFLRSVAGFWYTLGIITEDREVEGKETLMLSELISRT